MKNAPLPEGILILHVNEPFVPIDKSLHPEHLAPEGNSATDAGVENAAQSFPHHQLHFASHRSAAYLNSPGPYEQSAAQRYNAPDPDSRFAPGNLFEWQSEDEYQDWHKDTQPDSISQLDSPSVDEVHTPPSEPTPN